MPGTGKPKVQCYICKRTFQKRVEGAAHRRNYYRCADCLEQERKAERMVRRRDRGTADGWLPDGSWKL